jgi:nitroreductase
VVVTDRATLDLLAEKLPSAKMLSKAGAAIIICAIPEKAHGGLVEYAVIDCSLAGENILLAVESLGLGGIWTACYPNEDRMKTVRTILGIPENIIPLNVMPIGHPTGEDKPKDKFNPGNIRWEKW